MQNTDTGTTTLLDGVVNRMRVFNSQQSEYIYGLSNKIHSIFNRREPEEPEDTEKASTGEKPIGDMIGLLNEQLAWMENNTIKLSSIESHINEII